MSLSSNSCPECSSENIKKNCTYIVHEQERKIYHCENCNNYFSETKNTPLEGLRTPLSRIITVLDCCHYGNGYQRD